MTKSNVSTMTQEQFYNHLMTKTSTELVGLNIFDAISDGKIEDIQDQCLLYKCCNVWEIVNYNQGFVALVKNDIIVEILGADMLYLIEKSNEV